MKILKKNFFKTSFDGFQVSHIRLPCFLVFVFFSSKVTTSATSLPCLWITESVRPLLFRNIPLRHSFAPHFYVMLYLRTEPPPVVIHVILLIWSQSPYGSVIPITLLQPADLGERRPSSQPRMHPCCKEFPNNGFSAPFSVRFIFPNYLIRIFSVILKRPRVKKRLGYLVSFFLCEIRNVCGVGPLSWQMQSLHGILLLLLIRVEHAQINPCWNQT